ncbi:hypothetical protein ACFX12_008933 [Malus domestica]
MRRVVRNRGNILAGLRVVCKHLGKSWSFSSTVAAAPSGVVITQMRDDSLLQQQDGIQSAILHCKRSFNASRAEPLSSKLLACLFLLLLLLLLCSKLSISWVPILTISLYNGLCWIVTDQRRRDFEEDYEAAWKTPW